MSKQDELLPKVAYADMPEYGNDWLRLSKSGYSLKVGWGYEMRIVATSPKPLHELPPEQQRQWIDDAYRLCDGWNAVHNTRPTPQADEVKRLEEDWIDVQTQFPDSSPVLVWDGNQILAAYNGLNGWVEAAFFEPIENVQKWRPLPPPPAALSHKEEAE